MEGMGTEQALATAYHQQTDGQTERKIQELQAYFRHYLDYLQQNWIEITPLAQYAVNDAKSAATGETPNFITFGTRRYQGKDKRENGGTTHKEMMMSVHEEVKKKTRNGTRIR